MGLIIGRGRYARETYPTFAARGDAFGGGPVFVLDELSQVYPPGGNVYTSWAALMLDANQVKGQKWIDVVGTGHVTAGSWNMDLVTFVGEFAIDGSILLFAAGATFTATTFYMQNIGFIQNGGAGAPVVVPNATDLEIFMDAAFANGSATGPFFSVLGSGNLIVQAYNSSVGDGVNVAVAIAVAAGVFDFFGDFQSFVAAKAVSGPLGSGFVETLSDDSFFNAQINFLGTRLVRQAATLPYAARLSNSSPQNIPSNTPTIVTLASTDYANAGGMTNYPPWTANVNALTAPTGGVYRVSGVAGFASGALPIGANTASIEFKLNGGVGFIRTISYQVTNVALAIDMQIELELTLNAGDFIQMAVTWAGAAGNAALNEAIASNPQLRMSLIR
jgi:hypothetical protein